MDSHNHLFSLLFLYLALLLSLSGQRGLQAEASLQHEERHLLNNFHATKLFVFGDSYADTGNTRKGYGAWEDPYGMTFPGKPSGRASDGRVLTDYIAKYLGVKSPVPYTMRKLITRYLKYGVNFAYGGTGVFDTYAVAAPNMTTQIDLLQQLIKDNVYTTTDLSFSAALVSVAGNDYGSLVVKNGSTEGILSYIAPVANQITTNLIRIRGLGVKKIAVTGLEPLGCVPLITAPSSFKQCNDTFNAFVNLHNTLLNEAVAKLNQETKDHSTFVLLDLYASFMSVLNHPKTYNIQNPLKPCCVGVSSEYLCGDVDANKVKKYHVCDDPKSAFFWDSTHPTQAGWQAVYNKLRTTSALQQLQC